MESLLEGLAGLAEPFVELLFELIEDGLFCEAFSSTSNVSPSWLRPSIRFAIAALVILFTGALFSIVTRQSDALLAAQLTADHVKCFGLFRPGEGTTMDAAMHR